MIFHGDPLNYLIECDDEDNLLYTCTRDDRSSPRIRYDLGEKAGYMLRAMSRHSGK